jgi:ribosomal protein S18 acetylase RimI-like enzyme
MRGQAGQLSPDPFTLVHRVWLSTWLPFGRSANHASGSDAGRPERHNRPMTEATRYVLRSARAADYDTIAAVVDDWWGRPILPSLPRLFLDHFHRTSLIAESGNHLRGFLVGIVSPSEPNQAHIHFVGVCPQARNNGLARTLYEQFFQIARSHNCRVVSAITSPVNQASIAFHRRLGFTVSGPVPDYNGPGRDLIVFERTI